MRPGTGGEPSSRLRRPRTMAAWGGVSAAGTDYNKVTD